MEITSRERKRWARCARPPAAESRESRESNRFFFNFRLNIFEWEYLSSPLRSMLTDGHRHILLRRTHRSWQLLRDSLQKYFIYFRLIQKKTNKNKRRERGRERERKENNNINAGQKFRLRLVPSHSSAHFSFNVDVTRPRKQQQQQQQQQHLPVAVSILMISVLRGRPLSSLRPVEWSTSVRWRDTAGDGTGLKREGGNEGREFSWAPRPRKETETWEWFYFTKNKLNK